MPLQATSGAASYDAFGGGVPVVPQYIEDVFSTYLYTGNGSTQTITNGIDLSTKGGLVWAKVRSIADIHALFDTVRGVNNVIQTQSTTTQSTLPNALTAFNTNGFSLGSDGAGVVNSSGQTYVSWTFREQPKFFDVVTFSGNSVNGRTISHGLGSVPGFIIIKSTTASTNWTCYHRSIGATNFVKLNATDASDVGPFFNDTTPTSTQFTVSGDFAVNQSGETYVAYLFAHNAGGFGLTGTDNVISCGSVTRSGSGVIDVNLGYEPQWVLFKSASNANNWRLFDVMRGMPVTGDQRVLNANLSDAEDALSDALYPTSTGFAVNQDSGIFGGAAGSTSIYIAIRRGPMKVPTSGTSVFGLNARTGTGANATVTGGQTDDAVLIKNRGSAVASLFSSRLTGTGYLVTSATDAEVAAGVTILQANPWDVMDGVKVGTTSTITNASSNTYINYLFKRAPSFFDEVCWTSNDTYPQVLNHNLTVAPELIIRKPRSIADEWAVGFNFQTSSYKKMALNTTAAQTSYGSYSSGEFPGKPTATQFTDQGSSAGRTFVAYLFASCAGVSKVGSYTGTATTLQIDCGFTAGARFVLIKRTDSTGDWYVWDSARGIVSGNDPYLLLNSTAAEVTSTDYIDTYSAGFEISSTAPAAINASGGTYIFLAIA